MSTIERDCSVAWRIHAIAGCDGGKMLNDCLMLCDNSWMSGEVARVQRYVKAVGWEAGLKEGALRELGG